MCVRVVEVELGGTQSIHYSIKDTELSSSKSSNHNTTRQETYCAKVDKSNLLGNVRQTGHHRSVTTGTGLVHLGQEGISRVGNDSGGNSRNHTGSERYGNVGTA